MGDKMQEYKNNTYRMFRGLQNPSDLKSRHSLYTVPPARNYATIPWWTFRKPVYEDVHVFMGKRTADKATGFSPDTMTEDKATMTGSDEEDEDDDLSKRRRNILEEDLNITFEVELDSDDDEDDFRPKVSSTDPTLRVDFKIIRKHSSQSANNTEIGDYYTDDEKTKFDPQKESSVCVADGNHEMSDEMFEVNNDNSPVSLADVIADILDSEQESRLYKALMGDEKVDNKAITATEYDELLPDIGGYPTPETYDNEMADTHDENVNDALGSNHDATQKACTEEVKTANDAVDNKPDIDEDKLMTGELINAKTDKAPIADEGHVHDAQISSGQEKQTFNKDCQGDESDEDISGDNCVGAVELFKSKPDVFGHFDDDNASGIIGVYTRGQLGLEYLVQKPSSNVSHVRKHRDSEILGIFGVYAHGQCNFECLSSTVDTKHIDDDDDDGIAGIFGAFTRE